MKKNIVKNLIAVILILAIISCLDHVFIPKYIDENQDGRITGEFYQEDTDIDVLGLGSSTMYNAMSPVFLWNEYGFTSYVRSNASQTLWQSYYLLEDALKYKKPELVVLDVSFIKYGEEFIEEPSNRKAIEGMRSISSKCGAIKASMYSEEEPLSYFFPILRYHSRWKELSPDDLRYAYTSPAVTFNGYLMEFQIPEQQSILEPEELGSFEFPGKALEYLDKIIELCKRENIPLLLMKTPTYVNSWHSEYDYELDQIASGNGLTYVNFDAYKDEMGLNVRTDYIDDGSHLNIVGAEKFSEIFGQYITENYTLPDHSDDTHVIAQWIKKTDRYNQRKNEGMKEYEELLDNMGL